MTTYINHRLDPEDYLSDTDEESTDSESDFEEDETRVLSLGRSIDALLGLGNNKRNRVFVTEGTSVLEAMGLVSFPKAASLLSSFKYAGIVSLPQTTPLEFAKMVDLSISSQPTILSLKSTSYKRLDSVKRKRQKEVAKKKEKFARADARARAKGDLKHNERLRRPRKVRGLVGFDTKAYCTTDTDIVYWYLTELNGTGLHPNSADSISTLSYARTPFCKLDRKDASDFFMYMARWMQEGILYTYEPYAIPASPIYKEYRINPINLPHAIHALTTKYNFNTPVSPTLTAEMVISCAPFDVAAATCFLPGCTVVLPKETCSGTWLDPVSIPSSEYRKPFPRDPRPIPSSARPDWGLWSKEYRILEHDRYIVIWPSRRSGSQYCSQFLRSLCGTDLEDLLPQRSVYPGEKTSPSFSYFPLSRARELKIQARMSNNVHCLKFFKIPPDYAPPAFSASSYLQLGLEIVTPVSMLARVTTTGRHRFVELCRHFRFLADDEEDPVRTLDRNVIDRFWSRFRDYCFKNILNYDRIMASEVVMLRYTNIVFVVADKLFSNASFADRFEYSVFICSLFFQYFYTVVKPHKYEQEFYETFNNSPVQLARVGQREILLKRKDGDILRTHPLTCRDFFKRLQKALLNPPCFAYYNTDPVKIDYSLQG